jgi:hypothetical protein
MRVHEPITTENLCFALNRGTSLRLAPRDVLLAYHHWRWVAHLPGQRLAFVADTAYARQRLARERQLLQLLANRVHFQVPRLEWADPHGHWDVRLKVPGDAGHWSGTHHQRIIEDPAIAQQTERCLGEILAELHRVITFESDRRSPQHWRRWHSLQRRSAVPGFYTHPEHTLGGHYIMLTTPHTDSYPSSIKSGYSCGNPA